MNLTYSNTSSLVGTMSMLKLDRAAMYSANYVRQRATPTRADVTEGKQQTIFKIEHPALDWLH